MLGVQTFPQALWQGGAPIAAPQTVVYSNGLVLYDWGSPARAQHNNYDVTKTYYDAAEDAMITKWSRKWKTVQLTKAQLDELVASLREPDLDKMNKTIFHYDKLPHYVLSYWPDHSGGKPRTIIVGGPLNAGDCKDSFYKTSDLHSLEGATDYDVDDARSRTPKPLLSAIDALQFFDMKQAAFPEPNTYFIHLSAAGSSRALPWPDNLPQIDESMLKPDNAGQNDYTGGLEPSDYKAVSDAIGPHAGKKIYLIAGKPWHVTLSTDYMPIGIETLEPVLIDQSSQ